MAELPTLPVTQIIIAVGIGFTALVMFAMALVALFGGEGDEDAEA